MSEVVAMRARKPSALEIAPNFYLPIDAATETFAILGRRGSGKTHTAVVLAEEFLAAGVQLVVIDPLDVWWGLRVSKDGKSAGIPIYVCGGSHADVPLVADAGKVLADAVVDNHLSVILSLRHLSKSDQKRFVGEFCERLYDRKGDQAHRSTLHLFVDEADAFVPQRIAPGSERCFGAVDTLVRRGRSSGLATTLISQRPQVINKDVLSQTEVLVSHQVTGPQDRKALESWIEANDEANHRVEFLASLASLPRGTAWFWSPGLLNVFTRIPVRDRRTFDSSATPKPGARTVTPTAFAAVDIEALTKEIAATVERAKAEDPKELRRLLAEKEREIDRLRSAAPAAPAEKRVDVPVLTEHDRENLAKIRPMLEQMAGKLGVIQEEIIGDAESRLRQITESVLAGARAAVVRQREQFLEQFEKASVKKLIDKIAALNAPQRHTLTTTSKEASESGIRPAARISRPAPQVSSPGDSSLPSGERKMLVAVAQYADRGGATRVQLSMLTGFKRSTRDRYIQFLTQKGLAQVEGDSVQPTAAGFRALGDFEPLPTGDALLEHWLEKLPAGESSILRVVASKYPKAVDRDAITEATGFARSTRDRYVQFLQARKLVSADRNGVVASEELFG